MIIKKYYSVSIYTKLNANRRSTPLMYVLCALHPGGCIGLTMVHTFLVWIHLLCYSSQIKAKTKDKGSGQRLNTILHTSLVF